MSYVGKTADDAKEVDTTSYTPQDPIEIPAGNKIKATKIALVKYNSKGDPKAPPDQVRLTNKFVCMLNSLSQMRLYYIGPNATGKYRLNEICLTADAANGFQGQSWFQGDLTGELKNEDIDPKGPLSATVIGSLIKVYYKKLGEEKLRLTYNVPPPSDPNRKWTQKYAMENFPVVPKPAGG